MSNEIIRPKFGLNQEVVFIGEDDYPYKGEITVFYGKHGREIEYGILANQFGYQWIYSEKIKESRVFSNAKEAVNSVMRKKEDECKRLMSELKKLEGGEQ